MKKAITVFLLILLSGCSQSSYLKFGVSISIDGDVDPLVARKIVLSYLLNHDLESKFLKLTVSSISKNFRKKCFDTPTEFKIFGEYCAAQYMVGTEYIKNEGYSEFRVIEVCEGNECQYSISEINQGIIE